MRTVLTTSYDDTPEIKRRIANAKNVVVSLTKIWKDKGISLITKKRLLSSLVFSIASYSSECWTLKESDKNRIESFELWCYRRVLRISWITKTSNEEVLRKLQPDLRLLDSIWQRKLGLVGHILREEMELREHYFWVRFMDHGDGVCRRNDSLKT